MIDKIFKMYLMLLNNKKLTAKRIADELEISTRTVYRYVNELSASGVFIDAQKGPDGGIYIYEDSKLYSVALSKEEKNMLVSAIDMMEASGNFEMANTLRDKIMALNNTTTDIFTIDNKKIVVDNSYINKNDKIKTKISVIDKAISKRNVLEIQYHDRNENVSSREIEPMLFVIQQGTWYTYAWCRKREDFRLFKLSRINHIKNTNKEFERRKLSPDWTLVFDNKAPFVDLYLEVKSEGKYQVEEWLGLDSMVVKKDKNIAIATIRDDNLLYEKLLSLGSNVKVLKPMSVREKLIKKIKELNDLY